jgi:restriction system protein
MEKAQRTKSERCPSCGRLNRVVFRRELFTCSGSEAALPPLPPVQPAKPTWGSPLGLLRHLWKEWRLPNLYGYLRDWRHFSAACRSYEAAEREFRLREATRQRQAEADQLTARVEAEQETLAKEERERREEQRRKREEQQKRELEPSFQRARRERKESEERLAREDWVALHKRLQFERLDQLTGPEFEQHLAILFRHKGYVVQLTKGSGDQGADLLLKKDDDRIAFQAKRYKGRVGNDAVQELLGGMRYYSCSRGIVVTTSDFTHAAASLAATCRDVELWGRSVLHAHFMNAFPSEPPPFSWGAYRRLKSILEQER